MRSSEFLEVRPGGILSGQVTVPGDKSISHRAVMLATLSDGRCSIDGCLMGEDVLSTLEAMRAMGAHIEITAPGSLVVHGVGMRGLAAPSGPLYLGNSGTSMRLLSGMLAGAGIPATLTGDASLSGRPMRRVTTPLTQMGAAITTAEGGTPPVHISAGRPLAAIDYTLPVASAQVKSALLLAGLFATGVTRVREGAPTRDHTERMFGTFAVEIEQNAGCVALSGGQRLRAADIVVPADISSAAFFLVGAAIAPSSSVTLPAVGVNPTRTGILDILAAMNARITRSEERAYGQEPVANLHVEASPLRGIDIPAALVPLAIDEFPAIFVAAACAAGTTRVRGAAELRHKESDRIAVMARGLATLGIEVETFDDGIAITGGTIRGGRIDAAGDHRIAMAFAMAALRASEPVVIDNAAAIATSFPEFVVSARAAGLAVAS